MLAGMTAKPSEDPRVAELEAEVARLRQRLGEGGPAVDASVLSLEARLRVSRGRVIALAITIALLALGAFLAVFITLSSGFDSLARKAAKSFSPAEAPPASAGTGTGSGNAPPPPGPVVPGL